MAAREIHMLRQRVGTIWERLHPTSMALTLTLLGAVRRLYDIDAHSMGRHWI